MTDYSSLKRAADAIGCAYTENEPMSRHTTFGIGGTADIYFVPAKKEALAAVAAECDRLGVPSFIFGCGSNTLVCDGGIRGAVISTTGLSGGIALNGACEIVCDAGVKLSRLCSFALENSLTGLEFAWGIPGSLGGAVYMNAGAYGGEMKDVLVSVEYVDRSGNIGVLSGEELGLGYRRSAFMMNGNIILSATLRLHPGDTEQIRERMDALIAKRREKQPLEYPSAGSTFKRPNGYFAAELIDDCGLRGCSVGGAQVSEKHTGFIINRENATAEDVLGLIDLVRGEVKKQKGIDLECEIRIVGERAEVK